MHDEQLHQVRDSLRTLDALDDARTAHARLGRVLLATTGADFTLSFTLHESRGRDYMAELLFVGAPDLDSFVHDREGRAVAWLPWREQVPAGRNRFVEAVAGTEERWRERWTWQSLYTPFGITAKHRILVYDGLRFVHYLGVGVRGPERLASSAARKLEALTGDVTDIVRVIDHLRRTPERDVLQPACAQFRGDGHCELATPLAQRILDASPALRAELSDRVRAIDRRGDAMAWSVRGRTACEIVRMTGAGETRYLAVWHALQRPRLGAASLLTPRQLEVARFAASGATVTEIATTLAISPNTIKHHLRCIYRALEVSSRVELMAALTSDDEAML